MSDFKSIRVTKRGKSLKIYNPTNYKLIGKGAQGAVFKLSEDKCVKIYADEVQATMERRALRAGRHFSFFPKVYRTGRNYIVMEYFNAPTLKEYLRNCTYMPESMTKKLLYMLRKLRRENFTMIDAPLRHIFVTEKEELKIVDHVNAFKRNHPAPIKLLRDLQLMLLKDSFLSQVKKLEPYTYRKWQKYYQYYTLSPENGLKVSSRIVNPLIGKGLQGAVYRVDEDLCVKIYENEGHAEQEKKVLLSSQHLPFIPKVYDTGPNYILMEYLAGPDLNTYLKKQTKLSEEITRELLAILKTMKESGFKRIDAPLRHVIITRNGFKLVDHVYSFTNTQTKPFKLFEDLQEKQFLDTFLEQVKEIDPQIYKEWIET